MYFSLHSTVTAMAGLIQWILNCTNLRGGCILVIFCQPKTFLLNVRANKIKWHLLTLCISGAYVINFDTRMLIILMHIYSSIFLYFYVTKSFSSDMLYSQSLTCKMLSSAVWEDCKHCWNNQITKKTLCSFWGPNFVKCFSDCRWISK